MKSKSKILNLKSQIVLLLVIILFSCNPEAPWTTNNVRISMQVDRYSAGFVDCSFATNKDAYYLIGITPAPEELTRPADENLFMQHALDSVYADYQYWRQRLENLEVYPIAPFSSHSLQYGAVQRIFTGLRPDTEYWIYAFVVNPDKRIPVGHLHLISLRTTEASLMEVGFDYRVKGRWDYVYPLDTLGNIDDRFPYLATTRDSAEMAEEPDYRGPEAYFMDWLAFRFSDSDFAVIHYGVKATYNDGFDSWLEFQPGHTYYTCIAGYDGTFRQIAIYKFTWTGDNYENYFSNEDNLVGHGEDE